MHTSHERRVHRVFVTRNTEYHMRANRCVAVRERVTGEWLDAHLALNRELQGGLRFFDTGGMAPNIGQPEVGESLFFHAGGRDLVTSPVVEIARPEKHVVACYA